MGPSTPQTISGTIGSLDTTFPKPLLLLGGWVSFPGAPGSGAWSAQEPPGDTMQQHHLVAELPDTEGRSRERVQPLGLGQLQRR